MRYKALIYSILFVLIFQASYAQDTDKRIADLKNKLEIVATTSPGLTEVLNTDIALNNVSLSNFLLAISNVHKVNMNVATGMEQNVIANNFSNVQVATVILFLCKEYNLTIEFTESILSVKPYEVNSKNLKHPITIVYEPQYNEIDIDAKDNDLYNVFKAIMDATGKNLVFAPGMETLKINAYMRAVNFDTAMHKLALVNNLSFNKTDDNFYVFNSIDQEANANSVFSRRLNTNVAFEVLDRSNKLLNVNFNNTSIEDIVNQLGDTLAIDRFTATPLKEAGSVTFRAKSITFDQLLNKIFEQQTILEPSSSQPTVTSSNRTNLNSQNKSSSNAKRFTYKKENNIYYFGTERQLSVRNVEIIKLRHRSVNLMPEVQSDINTSVVQDNFNRSNRNVRFNPQANPAFSNTNRPLDRTYQNQNALEVEGEEKDILSLIPQEVKQDLDFKVDTELNSIYVTGTDAKIEFFKDFIRHIDKPIPVIIIEVMIVEANVNNTVETGIEWGIGDAPVTTQGGIFPSADVTLGSKTINKIINGFSSTSAFNFGQVVPNFFATIKAMETNGDLKIKSTPKLATLNGHRASFSNGQTSYYAVTDRNTFGTDNPITNEIRNFFPIDAKLGLDIKPFVTGDGQVLLNINVVQSSFGNRISEDAPPDINSRNFSSTIRMKDQDIAVLGGLEENFKNNSGSGVPFLARVPVIKWLFSKRKREARKSKLTVFIKPTVIN
ncbi:type II secretion system protein GspD [Winogradskyella haliclonae]|uniref:General secretion pathway protein GspD n=1 Tax=Winogradskyella haliclonae TaxID=2048558 RepID=A0ABQ2C2R4_9FLAO|nr:general secretion pathway protein GspD [Winogradskyella haliclonae]GGI58501.1 general secretion pathway protein GspD [Winogradskyella haliclonae]